MIVFCLFFKKENKVRKFLLYTKVNGSDLDHIYPLSTILKNNGIKSISSISPGNQE